MRPQQRVKDQISQAIVQSGEQIGAALRKNSSWQRSSPSVIGLLDGFLTSGSTRVTRTA